MDRLALIEIYYSTDIRFSSAIKSNNIKLLELQKLTFFDNIFCCTQNGFPLRQRIFSM